MARNCIAIAILLSLGLVSPSATEENPFEMMDRERDAYVCGEKFLTLMSIGGGDFIEGQVVTFPKSEVKRVYLHQATPTSFGSVIFGSTSNDPPQQALNVGRGTYNRVVVCLN